MALVQEKCTMNELTFKILFFSTLLSLFILKPGNVAGFSTQSIRLHYHGQGTNLKTKGQGTRNVFKMEQVQQKCHQTSSSLFMISRSTDVISRRALLNSILVSTVTVAVPSISRAEEAKVWISGKNPVPNKDKSDKTGTKKDSKYLRSMADCIAKCQAPGSGLAKERGECQELCRDECCTTYEQCTYKIASQE
mmetsp:Transcript_16832/g.21617  ORF Transcript_16832/g.21617 Transcript_16832/m.21617 type:complete len:193 (-) Transcript_16832:269-847(-)